MTPLTRREWLAMTPAALGATLTDPRPTAAADANPAEPFGYCLNTSTISGQKLTVVEELEIAAKAGYQGVELWLRELEGYAKGGGSLKDLGQRARDLGLTVEDGIAFAEWIVDDDARRHKALEDVKRQMELLQQVGGKRLAAPPAGATNQPRLDLSKAAERYRALLEVGDRFGIVPVVELWGHSQCLHRLGEALLVAAESGHPKACVLPDTFHLYKGGSGFGGLHLLGPKSVGIFHVNDYPAFDRAAVTDAQRVYPGDGVAPWGQILRDLRDAGYRGMLSLELFNRDYWQQDPLLVARTGLEKLRAVVRRSLA
jgi:sugar phosphate isomerase/epimerase